MKMVLVAPGGYLKGVTIIFLVHNAPCLKSPRVSRRLLDPLQYRFWRKVTPQTWMKRHRLVFGALCLIQGAPLDEALATWICYQRAWKETTMKSYMGTSIGFCRDLEVRTTTLKIVDQTLVNLHPSRQAYPIKKADMYKNIGRSAQSDMKVFLFLCWKTASRVGDILPSLETSQFSQGSGALNCHPFHRGGKTLTRYPLKGLRNGHDSS